MVGGRDGKEVSEKEIIESVAVGSGWVSQGMSAVALLTCFLEHLRVDGNPNEAKTIYLV